MRTLTGHSGFVMALLQPRGNAGRLVSGARDGLIKVWDYHTGDPERTPPCPPTLPHSLTLYRRSLLADSAGTRRHGALPGGMGRHRAHQRRGGHDYPAVVRRYTNTGNAGDSKMGRLAAVLSSICDGVLRELSDECMYECMYVADGTVQHRLSGHGDHVYSLTVLSNERLASGSRDHTAKIWSDPLTTHSHSLSP